MTTDQRELIIAMRGQGCGYTDIAKTIGISKDTVKSFCKRNSLGGQLVIQTAGVCPNCGKEVSQAGNARTRRFCSSSCRQAWWNAHPERVQRKAVYNFVCAECGKAFSAYGNNKRKYCCHECYVQARFKRGGIPCDT